MLNPRLTKELLLDLYWNWHLSAKDIAEEYFENSLSKKDVILAMRYYNIRSHNPFSTNQLEEKPLLDLPDTIPDASGQILTKELLEELYLKHRFSIKDIYIYLQKTTSQNTIWKFLKLYNIPLRKSWYQKLKEEEELYG